MYPPSGRKGDPGSLQESPEDPPAHGAGGGGWGHPGQPLWEPERPLRLQCVRSHPHRVHPPHGARSGPDAPRRSGCCPHGCHQV